MRKDILPGAGVILAGGSGTRMGANKALLSWRGKTLLSHIVEIVSSAMAETLIIGGNSSDHDVPSGKVRFLDEVEKVGPLGALLLGLKSTQFSRILLVACDMPFVSRRAIGHIWKKSEGFDVTLPTSESGLHPLFGVYDKTCIPHIESALSKGERKAIIFFDFVKMNYVATSRHPDFWERVLVNLNSPEDYQKALAMDGQTTFSA